MFCGHIELKKTMHVGYYAQSAKNDRKNIGNFGHSKRLVFKLYMPMFELYIAIFYK